MNPCALRHSCSRRACGVTGVTMTGVREDQTAFKTTYDPGNPAADAKGYVRTPNVNPVVEVMDMREAQRSYEADLTVMDTSKQMLAKTVDLLSK